MPLCMGNDFKYITPRCPDTKTWRLPFISKKLLCVNEELEHRKIIIMWTDKGRIIRSGE
jgi:hypothetical protein